MKSEVVQNLLTDSSARAKFFAQYFAIFAVIYHVAFIVFFYVHGIMPMVYMNLYSVPFFIILAAVSPYAKKYVLIYLLSCLEVYTHQILGLVCLGGESAFHFFFIPFALLPLYTFKEKFSFAMVLSLIGGAVYFVLELFNRSFTGLYTVQPELLSIIRGVNVFLAVAVILSSVFIYAYIAWMSEKTLELKVVKKSKELLQKDIKVFELQKHTVNSLANLVENRDSETGEHIQRTSYYVELIARSAMNKGIYPDQITEEFIERLKKAAPMHDIGKIVITDTILKKPSRLSVDEYEDIKRHTVEGAKIVKEIIGVSDDKDYIRITQEVALSHHERWDGTGYPNGLREQMIPISARIMAIADVYDALVSQRCYKKELPAEEAFNIISRESGKQFDPVLVEVFLSLKHILLSKDSDY